MIICTFPKIQLADKKANISTMNRLGEMDEYNKLLIVLVLFDVGMHGSSNLVKHRCDRDVSGGASSEIAHC